MPNMMLYFKSHVQQEPSKLESGRSTDRPGTIFSDFLSKLG
jgi:hypothetical protein